MSANQRVTRVGVGSDGPDDHRTACSITRQVDVPWARSLPSSDLMIAPEAVQMRLPLCTTWPSQTILPVVAVIGLTRLNLVSRVV